LAFIGEAAQSFEKSEKWVNNGIFGMILR